MYRVQAETGEVFRLYRQTIEDFSLYPGRELSQPELEKLRESAGQMSAKMRAVRIIYASGVSKTELKRRLEQKGEDPEQAGQAVQWLTEMGLLDDRKTAAQIVERCIARGYGINRARQALYEKKIPQRYWEEVLSDYPDQQEKIIAFLQSRLSVNPDGKERKRAVDALMRRGYKWSEIRGAMAAMRIEECGEDYDG